MKKFELYIWMVQENTHYVDRTEDYTYILKKVRIPHEIGNDAPRGGRQGTFLIVNDKEAIKRAYEYHLIKGKKMTKKRIGAICNFFDIKNYSINENLTIDVDGNVRFSYKRLTELPLNSIRSLVILNARKINYQI